VIEGFSDEGTEDIFYGRNTSKARRACPRKLWPIAIRKLDQLDSVERQEELHVPPGNHFEVLSGNRKGQYSIRLNDRYRIFFDWFQQGPASVEIVDYHRG
jgi:antitoxin HigA-1